MLILMVIRNAKVFKYHVKLIVISNFIWRKMKESSALWYDTMPLKQSGNARKKHYVLSCKIKMLIWNAHLFS